MGRFCAVIILALSFIVLILLQSDIGFFYDEPCE